MRILLDMDQVLTEWIGGACRAWGACPAAVRGRWANGTYDIVPPLSEVLGRKQLMTHEEFWTRLNGGPEFWEDLEPTPWMLDLVRHLQGISDDLWIVTAPSQCDYSYVGKRRWIRRYLPHLLDRLIPFSRKELLAAFCKTCVLIDDREEGVKAFRKACGKAVVFPESYNSACAYRADPVAYVLHQLEQYR